VEGDPQPPKDAVASLHVEPPPPYVEGIQDENTTIQMQGPARGSVEQGDPQPPKDAVASPQVENEGQGQSKEDENTTIQLQTPKDAVALPHVALVNDEGAPVTLNRRKGGFNIERQMVLHANAYYCGRRLGTAAIPGSDGMCGPTGTQCQSCVRFQELNGPPKLEGMGDWKGREVPEEFNDLRGWGLKKTGLDGMVGSTGPDQHEENNVCDQCDPFEIIPKECKLVLYPCLYPCCCLWACYLVFLIFGAIMNGLYFANEFAFDALGESCPIKAVETWAVKPGDGASLWLPDSPGWRCYNGKAGHYCGVDLEVFLSQMNNHMGGNTINPTYCKSCESYANNVVFRGGLGGGPSKVLVDFGQLVYFQKKLCRDFYRYTVKTPEGNDATTVACSCRPAGTTVEQCTRKSPSQTPVSEVGSLVEIWKPRTTPVPDFTAVYLECGDAQCYQTEDPTITKQNAMSGSISISSIVQNGSVVFSVLFVLCLAQIAWRKLQRFRRPAPASAICAICGRQNPRYLRQGLLREYMMTSYTVGSGH
jgi:hypothetical protein